jgi:hypothetical protein
MWQPNFSLAEMIINVVAINLNFYSSMESNLNIHWLLTFYSIISLIPFYATMGLSLWLFFANNATQEVG